MRALLHVLALALLLAGSAQRGTDRSAQAEQGRRPTGSAASPELPWLKRCRRDARVSFTRRTMQLAREALEAGGLDEGGRAAALFALGSAPQAVGERDRLFAALDSGTPAERRAAALGLGELAQGVEDDLVKLLEGSDVELAGCALLALLRTGRASARARVDALSTAGGPLAQQAVDALLFVVDRAASAPTPASELWLDLRWEAAKEYGLVDGEAWRTTRLRALYEDEAFLDLLVLPAAARLPRHGVQDHLLASLLADEREASLRAAALGLSGELALMLENELWSPSAAALGTVLDELERNELERGSQPLLEQLALREDDVGWRARLLLARAGRLAPLVDFRDRWEELDEARRVLACMAWSHAPAGEALSFLSHAERDESPRVRAAATLSRARLRDGAAIERVQAALAAAAGPERALFLELALACGRDAIVDGLLEEALEACAGEERLRVAATLVLRGRIGPRGALVAGFEAERPSGELGALVARALGRLGSADELGLLADWYPSEAGRAVDVAIARALVRAREPQALDALRAALWRGPFDRSVLAAALIVEVAGLRTLREEVERPPAAAASVDLRRVGFALGEWGGLAELEALERSRPFGSGDPVLQGALLGALTARTQ